METLIREDISVTSAYMRLSKDANADFFVSGFASSDSIDRDDQRIDPQLFELDTFRKNPQLWVNHGLWNDGKGNGIAVGSVVEVEPVRASVNTSTNTAVLYKLSEPDTVYVADLDLSEFLLKDGERGLWVICKVEEPDVIKLVESKRLNAFSWSGIGKRKQNGALKSIDLWEVSLVNVPANQKALFRIGKNLQIHGADGSRVQLDLSAVGHLSTPINVQLVALSKDELQMLASQTSFVDNAPTGEEETPDADSNPSEKGGEDQMTKEQQSSIEEMLQKMQTTLTTAVDGVQTQLTTLATKVESLEKGEETPETPDPNAKEPDAPSEPDNNAADSNALEGAITKMGETIASFTTGVSESIEKLSKRIEKIERSPNASHAPDDEDADALLQKTANAVREKMQSMTSEQRRAIERNALADVIVPRGVGRSNRVGV